MQSFPLPSMASTPRDAIPGGGKGEGTEFALFRDGDTATEEDCRDLKPLLRCFKLSTCRPPPVSPSRTARLRTVESQLRERGQRATRQVIAKMCGTMSPPAPSRCRTARSGAHRREGELLAISILKSLSANELAPFGELGLAANHIDGDLTCFDP